jgi:hypothetical protein
VISKLKEGAKGCQIDLINCTNPAFADDIAVVSIQKAHLLTLLDIAFKESLKWLFRFNATKTEIIIFGKDKNPSRSLRVGTKDITVKSKGTHLGVLLTDAVSEKSEWIHEKAQVAKRNLNAIFSLGNHRTPVSAKTASYLYWTVCMTKFCHGLEIAELPQRCITIAEQLHGHAAKQIQGLPIQSANAACCAPLGWRSFTAHLELLQMLFLWRILLLPINSIYKQVVIVRFYHLLYTVGPHFGPLSDILQVFTKYDLVDTLRQAITGNSILSIGMAKRKFKDMILEAETKRFKATCMLYKRLSMFIACIQDISMWPWWIYAHYEEPHNLRSCRTVCRLLFRETCLNADTSRFTKGSPMCTLCTTGQSESVTHLLFLCPYFSRERRDLWANVESNAPKAMVADMTLMDPVCKTEFILSGFKCHYIPEWISLYKTTLNFMVKMYDERYKYSVQHDNNLPK